jgi:hypothetical protein
MQDPAIENLDYLRQLIAEIRSSYDDMERLRMLYGTGMGTDSLQQGDR